MVLECTWKANQCARSFWVLMAGLCDRGGRLAAATVDFKMERAPKNHHTIVSAFASPLFSAIAK